jgi:hypothetical protein
MKSRQSHTSELDPAIARSCWGDPPLIAGGVALEEPAPARHSRFADPALWPSENFAQPLCDAKGAEKDEGEEEDDEDEDEFEDDDEDDEDEEFDGDDEFEDDDDDLFDGDEDDDEFGDDMDDEDDEDEDF